MKLLMISGDRSVLQGKKGAFWYTLEEFSKYWERIDVVCPDPQTSDIRHQIPFANVFFHSSPQELWYQPRWILKKGRELIAEHHHHVMTVHEYPPFYNGIGAWSLHRATGIPYALEIHHVVGYPCAASFAEWLGRMMSRVYLARDARYASAVRVVNASAKELLVTWGIPEQKIHVVPSFYLDADLLRPMPDIPKMYDVVFCARLVANKGLRELLDAIHQLPGVSLLVIGDGPERRCSELQAQSLGIAERVTFCGWIPEQQELVRAIQSAKIFVMNSKSEGGPRIALEAMACGMPVVATRVGVMPEVIQDGENGVFTSGEASDLAAKVRGLLEEAALCDQIGKNAQRIFERFERRNLIKAYADFLKSLA